MIWYWDVLSSAIASAGNTSPVAVFDVIFARCPTPVPAVICKSQPCSPTDEPPLFVTFAVGKDAAVFVSVVVDPLVACPVIAVGDAVRIPESRTAAGPYEIPMRS